VKKPDQAQRCTVAISRISAAKSLSSALDRLKPAVDLRCHQIGGENDARRELFVGEVRRNVVDEPTREADDVPSVREDVKAIDEGPRWLEVPLFLEPR
jgi:hypothetical protein